MPAPGRTARSPTPTTSTGWTPAEYLPVTEIAQKLQDPRIDAEGYLIEPDSWDEALGEALARAQGLELDDDHWFVIRFMREYQAERRITPDARHVMKHLEQRHPGRGRARLFELFPYGYVAQACRIAGMKRPRAWSTG
ncbi:MAG: TusE/DsrC/DsvC family sulfur relay protein [Rubrivivax sp.]|nr:TusE/DsrC/DsvC family sulfur relay protein [Rubrivivax sp.]